MFKHKRSQSGFGIVEALCFIVMFSMVGLIGWYVINENQNSQETLDNIGGAEVQTSSAKPATGDKFVFKELGVVITLSANLDGLRYIAKNESGSTYLNITTTDFSSDAKSCNKNADDSATFEFAALAKTSGQYPEDASYAFEGDLMKQFGNFYISASYPNGLICEEDTPQAQADTVVKKMKALQTDLKEAFKTATLVE